MLNVPLVTIFLFPPIKSNKSPAKLPVTLLAVMVDMVTVNTLEFTGKGCQEPKGLPASGRYDADPYLIVLLSVALL
jgi:hypothetical protein